jgi:hypothetical protein
LPKKPQSAQRTGSAAEPLLNSTTFVDAALRLTEALIIAVPAKCREKSGQVSEAATSLSQPDVELEVHADSIVLIQQESLLNDPATEERGGRGDIAAKVEQDVEIESVFDFRAHDVSRRVHKDAITINDVGVWVIQGVVSHGSKASRQVVIIRV